MAEAAYAQKGRKVDQRGHQSTESWPQAAQQRRSSVGPAKGTRPAAAPAALERLSRLQNLADASLRVAQLRRLQALADGHYAPVAHLAGDPEEEELVQGQFASAEHPPQRQQAPRANNTGLPDQLKSGIESMSGLSMDHVRVHYNSAQPEQLNALAYAQGSDIHLAPGQEQHLPHEAWHVLQQVQGRVRPTLQLKDGVPVNNDSGLEREEDVMGSIALEGRHRVVEANRSISTPIEPAQQLERDTTNSFDVNVANNHSAPLANSPGSAQRGEDEMQRIADQRLEAALQLQGQAWGDWSERAGQLRAWQEVADGRGVGGKRQDLTPGFAHGPTMMRRLHREPCSTDAVLRRNASADATASENLRPLQVAGSRHTAQRRKIDSSFCLAVTQRQIRVDAIEKGEPFDTEVDYVQRHWGFTQAEGQTYKAWLKDGVDHHYASKAELVEAIKAVTMPTTKSFANMFGALANEAGLSTAWLEQVLTAPKETLITLNQETPQSLALMLKDRGVNIDAAQLARQKLAALIETMLNAGTITQSCGQTVTLLREVIASASSHTPPLSTDIGAVAAKIREANAKAATEREHYYVSVEGGQHAFVVEVFNDRCRVYQSFFNVNTMARDMGRAQDFSINQFLQLLEVAFTANPDKGPIPRPVVQARQQLFASTAIHPDGGVRVSIFKQEQGAADRLKKRYEEKNETWKPLWDTEASNYLKEPTPESATPTGEKTITYRSEGYKFFDLYYRPINWNDMKVKTQYNLHFDDRVNLTIEVIENDRTSESLCFRVVSD